LYLALRKVDPGRLLEIIRSTDVTLILPVVLISVFQHVIRAWRWRPLLDPIKRTAFSNRILSTLVGFAANCVLPARLGEFIRANYLGSSEGVSSSSAFGTIVMERLLDAYTLLIILFIGLMGTVFPAHLQTLGASLRGLGFILLFVYSLAMVLLFGFKYKALTVLRLLDRLLFFFSEGVRSGIKDVLWKFSLGIVLLRGPLPWLQVIAYSCLLWFSHICQIELIETAAGLSIPFIAAFLVLAMASIGVMIPSAPGFIGTFHLSVQYGFLFYGVGPEEALSAAILWHAAFFFPTILLGFIAFIFLHLPCGRRSGHSPRAGIEKT
jgi:uncharacterized protein (TIRG00374 family)